MTFADYLTTVAVRKSQYPEERHGQAAFNALALARSDLSETVRACRIDPFYDDRNLPDFYEFVKANW